MTSERQRLLAIEIANALNVLNGDNIALNLRHQIEITELICKQQKEYVEGVAGQIESMVEPSREKVLSLCSIGGSGKEPAIPLREKHLKEINEVRARQRQESTALSRVCYQRVVIPILNRFFPEGSDGQSV